MRLIGRYSSPYVRRVAVTMQLYGLPYEHLSIMPFGDDQRTLLNHNPISRVPALQLDNDETLIDSVAFIDHLDTLVSDDVVLMPRNGPERRRTKTFVAVALGSMEKLVAVLYERHFRPPEMQFSPWIERCEQQIRDGFEWLENEFSGPYMTGDKPTEADISLAVFWLFGSAKRPGFFKRLQCRNIDRMSSNLAQTPAFRNTEPETQTLAAQLTPSPD